MKAGSKVYWWLPSISAAVWLVFVLMLVLTNWRLLLISGDGDACWHWRQGQWMLEHRAVMRADVFSYTRAGAAVVAKEWLSQVVLALAGWLCGWNGIVLVCALAIATTLWLLLRQLLAEGTDLLLAVGLVLLAAFSSSHHWLARPHVFAYLLLVIFAWQLRWFDRGRLSARQLLVCLVPVMVLWVNLHGSFLIGFLLIGLYWASSGVEWWRASPEQRSGWRSKLAVLLVLALACGCATLVNPNGWNLHRHIGRFLGSAYQLEYTDEWRAANFHAAGMRGFLGQLLLIGIVLLARQSSWAAVDVLLVGVCGYCGLYSVRNIPVFAIVVTPILAEHLGAVLCGMKTSRWGRRCQGISERITAVQRQSQGLMVGLGCVLVGVLVLATPRLLGGLAIIETELLADRFPVEAVRYLQSHAAAVEGNVFNEYNWGGYLMRYLPAKKLFIDSRNDFYGETLLKDFDEVDELKPGWQQILQKYDVRWTLLSVNHPLSNVLALREDWVLLYRDKVACIHVRR